MPSLASVNSSLDRQNYDVPRLGLDRDALQKARVGIYRQSWGRGRESGFGHARQSA